ncbi:MAG: hypothetical protein ACYDBB_16160 [Armatimonadota bacterium]
MSFNAGAATRVINPELGAVLAGQLHHRYAQYFRDDLEANFLYLTNEHERLLLVSLDLCGLTNEQAHRYCDAVAAETGIPTQNILLTCTHTHSGPDMLCLLYDAPDNSAYHARVQEWLVDGAREAVEAARPAKVGWARGKAHVGFNRRLCWGDGTHTMYGDATRPDFTGLEGPDDPSHAALFVLDADGNHLAILHNNCSHSTCMESDNYITADFPGEARAMLRNALDCKLPVLYLQGASGDTSPWDQLQSSSRYSGSQRAREMGALMAGETLRLFYQATFTDEPLLSHTVENIEMDVRLPTPDALAHARHVFAQGEEKVGRWDYILSVDGVLRLHTTFKDNPVDVLPVHAVRIGDFAIVTNTCELYCQFGLDIKRRSPAAVTAVAQLTNGLSGYCPTIPGLMGGGYSGDAIYWARLEPYAGYKLVEVSTRLLNQLWSRVQVSASS